MPAALFALSVLLSVLFRRIRPIALWGALWGAVFGIWIIAPEALRTHELRPDGVARWLSLWLLFTGVGAAMGVVLAVLPAVPLSIVWARRPLPKAPHLAAAFWGFVAVPAAYFLVSVAIETSQYNRLVSGDPRRLSVQLTILLISVISVALFAGYRNLVNAPRWASGKLPLMLGILGVVAGMALLQLRVSAIVTVAESKAPPLVRQVGSTSRNPLLVVGLDGGNWETLQPLIDSDRTPALASLMRRGQRGEVQALWPPYWSGPAWAAIVTGQPPAVSGVTGDLIAKAPGFPSFHLPLDLNLRLNPFYILELGLILEGRIRAVPMPRAQLKREPIWERVAQAGGRVAVVRFPFTFPSRDQSMAVVSNVVSRDLWRGLVDLSGIPASDFVSPAGLADPIVARFAEPPDETSAALRAIFPRKTWRWPPATPEHPVGVLNQVFDINEKTFDAAEMVLQRGGPFELIMLHVSSFDSICHAFWKFRFPEKFSKRLDPIDVDALGGVIDRYLEYLDRRLARIFALLPGANIVVVADHGQEAIQGHVMWNGWHAEKGVFLAGGPDIEPTPQRLNVSYFDILPIMLDLLGFERPRDAVGGKLVDRGR